MDNQWKKIAIAIDSGACDNVINPDDAGYEMMPTAASEDAVEASVLDLDGSVRALHEECVFLFGESYRSYTFALLSPRQ